MNAQIQRASADVAVEKPRPPRVAPGLTGPGQLTRVRLEHLPRRLDRYLRFGNPIELIRQDRWRRVAVFLPGEVFCRIHWQANEYGTQRWQLLVLRTCTPLDAALRIEGVAPGACMLLRAEGATAVKSVLWQIDAIEAYGIAPAAVSPVYWSVLANRLQARLSLPGYSRERHAAWLARRMIDVH